MLDFHAWEGQKVLKMLNPRNSGGAMAPRPLLLSRRCIQNVFGKMPSLLLSKIIFQLPRLSVHTSVRPSVRPYVRPSIPPAPPSASSPLGPKSKLYGPNPSKMVQIRPNLAKSRQNGLRPGKMGLIWLENLNSGLSSIILAP